jgi:hypothetical protein
VDIIKYLHFCVSEGPRRCDAPSLLTIAPAAAAVAASAPVSRFVCRSELYEFDLTLDVNVDVYPLQV